MKLYKKIIKNDSVTKFLAKVVASYMRFCFRTTRWKFIGLDIPEKYIVSNRSLLIALWHDRLMTAPCAWNWEKPLHVLASPHRDGKFIAEIVKNLKMKPVYGSTNNCSVSSLKEMLKLCNNGHCLAIIPDGPRGPRHTISSGILEIAKITKTDIVPFSCCVKKFRKCNSWDKFIIAHPFNKGVVICGAPLTYEDIKSQSIEECKAKLKDKIDALSKVAKLEMEKM